ncbi:hypothetical protein [Ruegeria sediminis]|nr:hypothetical protein [Ruegeria sediminis]
MAGYVSPPPPHPLGQHREKFERLRQQRGLDERGFPIKRETEPASEEDSE